MSLESHAHKLLGSFFFNMEKSKPMLEVDQLNNFKYKRGKNYCNLGMSAYTQQFIIPFT